MLFNQFTEGRFSAIAASFNTANYKFFQFPLNTPSLSQIYLTLVQQILPFNFRMGRLLTPVFMH